MSRPLLILVAILLVLIVGAIALGSSSHEVPQTRVEKPVAMPGAANAPQQ